MIQIGIFLNVDLPSVKEGKRIISPETLEKNKELLKFKKTNYRHQPPKCQCLRLRHPESIISKCIFLFSCKTWNGLSRSGTTLDSRNSLSSLSIEFPSPSTSLGRKQGVYCSSFFSHFVSAIAWSSFRGPARVETTRHRRSLDIFTILDETVLE